VFDTLTGRRSWAVGGSTTANNVLTAGASAGLISGQANLTFDGTTLTSTAFSGPLTGNVTGNVSGSSGSCTGNAATATTAGGLTGTPNITVGTITSGTTNISSALPWSGRSANPLSGQLIISAPSQRLILGSYYTNGQGAASTIQASDFYDAVDHGANLLLNPIGGYVGIGCNTPGYLLDVNGRMRATGGFSLEAVNYDNINAAPSYGMGLANYSILGTGAGYHMQLAHYYGVSITAGNTTWDTANPTAVFGNQKVGINMKEPAYTLDVSGTARAQKFLGSLTNATTTVAPVSPFAAQNGGDGPQNSTKKPQIEFQYSTGGFNHYIGTRHYGGVTGSTCNSIDFWLYSGTGANHSTVSSAPGTGNVNIMSVTAAGVGINCNAPQNALDVAGAARATTGVIGGNMVIRTWVANGEYASLGNINTIGTNNSYALIQHDAGETYLNSADGYALHLRTGNTDRMWISSAGVGIGTSGPQSTTHIQGKAGDITTGYGALLVDYPNAGGQGASVTIRNSGGGTGAFAALVFEVDGSTAIGTGSTPLVANQANGYIYCRNAGAGAGNDAGTMGIQLWSGAAENEVMTLVGSNQRVGINTTSPSYQLDVNGDIRAQYILWACNVRSTFGRTIGSATTVVSPFAAYNGDVNSGNLNLAQIEFQHYNGGGYTHYIGSRHEGGAGAGASSSNAIDFYLYSNAGGAAGSSTAPNSGNVRMMSVTAAGVGINNAAPAYKLDVSGTARITGVTTLKDKLDMSGNSISNVNTITGTAGYITVDPLITGNGNTFTRLFGSYYTPSPYNSDFFITNNLATLTSNSSNILTATYDYAAGTSAIRLLSPYAAAGGISFYAGNSSSVPVNVMTVVPTGVGINCNAPSWPMDVSGVVGITTTGTGQLILNSSNDGKSVIVRNDGGNFYLLVGSSHTSSWNSLRPFAFNLTNGNVLMEQSLAVKTNIDLCNTNLTNVSNVYGPGGVSTLEMSNSFDVNIKAGNNMFIQAGGTNYVGFYQASGGYVRLNPDTDLDILSRYTNLTNRALYLSHPGSNTGTNGAALQIFNTSASGSIVTPTSRYGNVWISAAAGSGESGSAISLDVGGYGGNIFGGIKQGYYGFLSFGTINDAAVNTERMRIIGTTGFVGINTPTPATTLDVNGGLTVRNGIRPLFSNTRASSITTDATSYGTYYYMTAAVSTITIGAPASTADSNAFWLFRNATSSYQNIVVTWPTIGGTAPSPSTDTFVVPPMNSMSIMYTPANGDYGSYSGVFNWAVF